MAGQCKKQGGLGIFGGSGEGMYYGVFGLAARCERSKPPPQHGKARLYPKKAGFKAGYGEARAATPRHGQYNIYGA